MAEVVTEDSAAGRNIKRAADFLADMGYLDEATNVEVWLAKGKILKDSLDENAKTGKFDKNITIDKSYLGNPGANKDFDDENRDWESIVELARILFHEKIHAHQNFFWMVWQSFEMSVTTALTWDMEWRAEGDEEVEAWEKTLKAMDKWIRTLLDRFLDGPPSEPEVRREWLRRISRLMHMKNDYIDDFIFENDSFASGAFTTWLDVDLILTEAKAIIDAALEIAGSDLIRVGREVAELIKKEDALVSQLGVSRAPVPRDDIARINLFATGNITGHIANMAIESTCEATISGRLPAGIFLVPANEKVTPLLVGSTVEFAIGAYRQRIFEICGISVDPNRALPDQGELLTEPAWRYPDSRDSTTLFPVAVNFLRIRRRVARSLRADPILLSKAGPAIVHAILWEELGHDGVGRLSQLLRDDVETRVVKAATKAARVLAQPGAPNKPLQRTRRPRQ